LNLDSLIGNLVRDFSNFLDRFSIVSRWEEKYIEQSLRKFIKGLHQTQHEARWSTATKSVKEAFHTNKPSINYLGASMVHIKGFRCITWKRNALWSFTVKLINNILPTGNNLAFRFPHLYSD